MTTTPSMPAFLRAAAIGGAWALAINLALYYVAIAAGWWDTSFVTPIGEPILAFNVAVFSVVPALIAGLLAGFLARSGSRGRKIFLGIAAVVFVVMIFPSASIGAPTSMVWLLEIMHGAAAVPIVMAIDGVFKNA